MITVDEGMKKLVKKGAENMEQVIEMVEVKSGEYEPQEVPVSPDQIHLDEWIKNLRAL